MEVIPVSKKSSTVFDKPLVFAPQDFGSVTFPFSAIGWPTEFDWYSVCNSGNEVTLSIVKLELKLTAIFPSLPDFVVIKITPFAPWLPYNAEADAPFNTVKLSMSSGLINDKASPPSIFPASLPKIPRHCLQFGHYHCLTLVFHQQHIMDRYL